MADLGLHITLLPISRQALPSSAATCQNQLLVLQIGLCLFLYVFPVFEHLSVLFCSVLLFLVYGFLRQHSQSHALFSAIEAIKHNRRMGRYVVVLSADIKKAYPTMLRAQMLNDLHDLGVDESLFHAIASMYTGNRSRILTSRPGVMSSEYTVENGLREGAVLSPLLYCIFTAALMRKLQAPENAPYGMHVGTEWPGAQLSADDPRLLTAHEDLDSAT